MDPVDPLTVEGLDAWRYLEAAQQPQWPDQRALAAAVAELSVLPPLVFAGECDNLRERLAAAARGEAFVLQGGDCAETFVDATADKIRNRIKTMLQMAVVLTYGAQRAGRQGRPDGRPVRQAAQQRRRDPRRRRRCRPTAATRSTTSRSRREPRHAGPEPAGAGLPHVARRR